MRDIRTIMLREWADTLRNKMIASMLVGVPLLMTAIPIGLLIGMKLGPINESDLAELGPMLANPLFAGMSPREALQSAMASQMMVLFLMMPLFVPVTISTYSIVGEKVARTLEPLLATPIGTPQLLAGKCLAAALPAVVITWLAYGLFLIFARMFAVSDRVFAVFVNPMWLVAMALLAPLLTLLAVSFGVIVSSRVNDPRAAEQIGGLLIIPLMMFFFGGLSGLIQLNAVVFLIACAVVLVADVALVYVGAGLFQREAILTRWK